MRNALPHIHPTEEAGAVTPGAVTPMAVTGLAALFTTHVLRDGELVLLILKPSLWFIPIQSMLFSAVVAVFACGAALANGAAEYHNRVYFEFAVILVACRLMWAALQWQGRLYVLTNLRVLRMGGVFATGIYDCPLRKVAIVRLFAGARERALGLGSLEIIPTDETRPPGVWQIVAHPRKVHDTVVAAINRAKQ